MAKGERTFAFMPTSLPSTKAGWAGLSGAPIVQDGGEVAGVVIEARTVFNSGSVLQCLPVSALMLDIGFLDHVSVSSGAICDLVAQSRICAELFAGRSIRQLQEAHAHKGWFIVEVESLLNAGIFFYKGQNLTTTAVGDSSISYVGKSNRIRFEYIV